MQLFGSVASPYVRRVRLLLGDRDYQFNVVNIFNPDDRALIYAHSPTLRIPLLLDGAKTIWDSLLICEYLNQKPYDLDTHLQLNLINELSDSAIQVFQLRKFGVDTEDKNPFSQNNLQRMQQILTYFAKQPLASWDVVAQWLYCTLDWLNFRNVLAWEPDYPGLRNFMQRNQQQPWIQATDPRLS